MDFLFDTRRSVEVANVKRFSNRICLDQRSLCLKKINVLFLLNRSTRNLFRLFRKKDSSINDIPNYVNVKKQ